MNKIVIISAPSGSGKSTLIGRLMEDKSLRLEFSISATTRQPRGQEVDGKDYYFLTPETFRDFINANMFVEYEQVYQDRYYGTLYRELDRISDQVEEDLTEAMRVQQDSRNTSCMVDKLRLIYIHSAAVGGRIETQVGEARHRFRGGNIQARRQS